MISYIMAHKMIYNRKFYKKYEKKAILINKNK